MRIRCLTKTHPVQADNLSDSINIAQFLLMTMQLLGAVMGMMGKTEAT